MFFDLYVTRQTQTRFPCRLAVHVANSKDLEIGVNLSGKRAGFTRYCGYLHAISCPSIYSALSLPLGD
jgi:hypothetical protein